MANTVDYVVTGYMNNLILVKFTMNGQSENLSFPYDGTKPIKEFLDEQAVFVMPSLKKKAEVTEVDLLPFVGTRGTVDVPDRVPLPMAGAGVSPFLPHHE